MKFFMKFGIYWDEKHCEEASWEYREKFHFDMSSMRHVIKIWAEIPSNKQLDKPMVT